MNTFDVTRFLGIIKPVHIWRHAKVKAKKEKKPKKASKSPITKRRFTGRQPPGEMRRQLRPVHWASPLTYETAPKLLVRHSFS